ncbi:dihydrofolate reductase family protein [Kribbella catacumbae]|uniref:dihydrofolate reductase family protein n=1 Tax=Kribbella catacumbae TaxID=460086 RepID=UPI001ED98F05|nr:dihydrofolate reductase family protein [Kribbella catacumbae]
MDEVRAGGGAILVGANTVRQDNPRLLVRSQERRDRRVGAGQPFSPTKVMIALHRRPLPHRQLPHRGRRRPGSSTRPHPTRPQPLSARRPPTSKPPISCPYYETAQA